MFIPQNHQKSQQRVQICAVKEKPVFRASLALSMLEIELYQISLPYDRGRSGYEIRDRVQEEFGGDKGHSCDLMSLDSNAMKDRMGNSLPHFTPVPSPDSAGVNLFAQDLSQHGAIMSRPHVFPPCKLVGPVLKFLGNYKQPFTLVVMDTYPRKYWWPIVTASMGDTDALLLPSERGWVSHKRGMPGDLWAFAVHF